MEKFIIELLDNNVRVVLPDLGAFIVKQRKPLKIIFNEFLKYNDGLLIEYIAKSENIEKDEATKKVTEFVNSVKTKLNADSKLVIEGLGLLHKDQAGNIAFDLDKDAKVKDIEGAKKDDKKEEKKEDKKEVKKPETKVEVKEEEKDSKKVTVKKEEKKAVPKEEVKPPPPPPPPSQASKPTPAAKPETSPTYTNKYTQKTSDDEKKRAWLWLVAAAMAILIVFLILNINKSGKSNEELVAEELNEAVADDNMNAETTTEDKIEDEAEIDNEPLFQEETVKSVTPGGERRYYIIAGSFKVPGNADNYVIYLRKKGYPAEKVGVFNEFHLVSVNSFVSKREALNELEKIRNEFEEEAWLKRY